MLGDITVPTAISEDPDQGSMLFRVPVTKSVLEPSATSENATKPKSKTVQTSLSQSVTEYPPTNAVRSTHNTSSSVADILNRGDIIGVCS